MSTEASKTAHKADAAKDTKAAETPAAALDRPMGGPLTRDDGVRTEHNLHPLDPCYAGSKLEDNKAIAMAEKAREEAGLVESKVISYGTDPAVEAKKNAA